MKTKQLIVFVLFLSGIAFAIPAKAAPGETCYSAIPLGNEEDAYQARITGPCTVWYSAWTFSLPLAVYFAPDDPQAPSPDVEMDFTCNGVYTDPIIATLKTIVKLPYKITEVETGEMEGKFVYIMSVGKKYRDLLLSMGVDYNVEAFVKVDFKSSGTIGIAPYDQFSSCMDGAKFMHFGDTIRVKAKDTERHVIVPYVQWRSDSIYYIWNGSKKANVWVSPSCKFDPTDGLDPDVLQRLKINPNDSVKLTSDKIAYYVDFEKNEAGMFFAKCYSEEAGVLTIKRIPQAPPREGAIQLKYDKVTDVPANNTQLFALHKSYNEAIKFTTPTNHIFRMYIGKDPFFDETNAIASYQFLPNEDGHWLGIFDAEMKELWNQASEQYLYVRFECTARTTILLSQWEPSDCIKNWELIPKGGGTFTIAKGSYNNVYRRFYYYDWKGGTITFKWNGTSGNCPLYIGNTCDFDPIEGDPRVVFSTTVPQRGGTREITSAEWDSYESKIDADGYLYLLCNPSRQAPMDITSNAPEEEDPVYPHTSIHVACEEGTSNVIVTVSKPQHIVVSGIGFNEEWDALPDSPKTLTLPTGEYMLQGTKEDSSTEQLVITIP